MLTLDALPDEIQQSARCVIWRRENANGNGRITKIPYVATEPARLASSTDPSTWRPFLDARNAFEDGKADGPGFVLGNGYVGIDIDHCVVDGQIDDDARVIVDAIGSYTELSPSETGLHILCRGSLPPGRRRIGRYELYDSGRYFTLTGRHVPDTPTTLFDVTHALRALHRRLFGDVTHAEPTPSATPLDDHTLLEHAFTASNGAAIRALWDGDVRAYTSRSEADLALCAHLAFWTGRDASRIDALFRRSALMREKWDERRGAETYGQITIATAIDGCQDVYSPTPEIDVVLDSTPFAERFPAFWARLRDRQAPADLVPGWIPGHGLTMPHGHPRTLKTWMLLELARACATGTAAFGLDALQVREPIAVWYLTEEDPELSIRDRFAWLLKGRDQAMPDTLHVSPQRGISFDDPAWQKRVIAYAGDERIRLLMLDPIRASSMAVDQGPRELAPLVKFLRVLMRATGCAIVFSHHDVKPPAGKPDDRARPHRASGGGIFSVVAAPIHCELVDPERPQALLTPGYFKFTTAPHPLLVTVDSDDKQRPTWVRVVGEPTSAATAAGMALHQRIRDYLREHPATSGSTLARAVKAGKAATLAALEQLYQAGVVDSFAKGQATLWSLTATSL